MLKALLPKANVTVGATEPFANFSVKFVLINETFQRKFSKNFGIALSELQRRLKVVRRASEPQLIAVQIEAAERNDRALELMAGEGYRIKIGVGFSATNLAPATRGAGQLLKECWVLDQRREFTWRSEAPTWAKALSRTR